MTNSVKTKKCLKFNIKKKEKCKSSDWQLATMDVTSSDYGPDTINKYKKPFVKSSCESKYVCIYSRKTLIFTLIFNS